ncbi:MAG TPA: protein tyrosine phosphatase family protein [Gammaproteobacteria bacterium]
MKRPLALMALATVAAVASAQDNELAVNHVIVHERLHTAGQPDETQLATLADRGFDLVINLAPPSAENAVHTEGQLVTEDGVAYVNIPVNWQDPQYQDFALFSAVMGAAGDRRVLVHCMVNARASMFTFLYQAVHAGVPVDDAYDVVEQVWEPERAEQWVAFGRMVLDRHGIEHDLFGE